MSRGKLVGTELVSRLGNLVRAAGFPYTDELIHLFIGGSELHGAKIEGTDDTDIYGLFVEPVQQALGLDKYEHFVYSTAGKGVRNTALDMDITLYSLHKWAGMACKGNPTALHFLFAQTHPVLREWEEFAAPARKFVLAKTASRQFMGFVDAQMGRLLGTRGKGPHGQRPELEKEFGYDVKAGMHAMRLLYECIELMRTGWITLPRPEKDLLIEVRLGSWSLDKLSNEVNKLFVELRVAVEQSKLPEMPDREALSRLVAYAYLKHWKCVAFR